MRAIALICLLLLSVGVARAEWREAASDHFVVYADDGDNDVRLFSAQLERFHAAMAALTGHKPAKPSPSNRVTVYVVASTREVRTLAGSGNRFIGGFYIPRAGGSIAIVPRVDAARGAVDEAMLILLHEYAHHFFIAANPFPLPRWLSEGAAEFFASARFGADGSVTLGAPAAHRAAELQLARDVTIADLLDPAAYARNKRSGYDAFYGKSWLLYHYLTFEPTRKGQLARYIALLTEGRNSRDAATMAFGDAAELEKETESYARKRKLRAFSLAAAAFPAATVSVRRLTAGEAAMMPLRIRSKRGVDQAQAQALLGEARAVSARFPGDAAVLAALAEAEYDAGTIARRSPLPTRPLRSIPGRSMPTSRRATRCSGSLARPPIPPAPMPRHGHRSSRSITARTTIRCR